MKTNEIFTEYNSNLINQIDRDPLGFQQIWTHFGQKIFENKTTSIATDIRNYTINLLHHNVIRQLPEKATSFWNIVSQRSYKEGIEKSIILLEMMLAHSRVVSAEEWTEPKGILGTSMAYKRWSNSIDIIDLESSLSDPVWGDKKNNKSFEMLLVRQTSLGINGRYKGPFMKMSFFSSDYKYSDFAEQWNKIDEAINSYPLLKELQEFIFKSLKNINKTVSFSSSSLWCKAYENAFKTHEITADFSFKFWPEHLGFKTGAAKAVFDILINNISSQEDLSAKQIFEIAKKNIDSFELDDIRYVQDILELEPILAQLDVIFRLLLKDEKPEMNIDSNILKQVKSYKLPSNSPERLKFLIKLILENDNIVDSLLKHHEKVMNERGNMPWMRKVRGKLKVYLNGETQNNIEDLKEYLNSSEKVWIHPYYIPSMRDIASGMIKNTQ